MRKEEAEYVGRLVKNVLAETNGSVLNLGSSTGEFRTIRQPHIHEYVFAPLENSGVNVVHTDLKAAEGVDIAGDLFDPAIQKRLQEMQPALVMACNLMEHLPQELRVALPDVLDKIIAPGRFLLITVPYSFPLHYDPIDTYFRPSPHELCALFPTYEIVDAQILQSTTYLADLRRQGWRRIVRAAIRPLAPFYKPRIWLSHCHRLTWLFRNYRVSCVLLRKPDMEG